jgi:hypothetical protein
MIVKRIHKVISSSIETLPIELNTGSNLFVYSGSMTAVIQGELGNNSITWEQIDGEPVTYTSSTDGLTITFTTTDLNRKVFKVYTNKGTPLEQSAIAEFVHFPVERILIGDREDLLNVKQTNTIRASDLLPAYKQNGLISIDPNLSNYAVSSYGSLADSADSFTGLIVEGRLPNDVIPFIKTSEVWEKVSGSWTLRFNSVGYLKDFSGKVPVTENEFKIVYTVNLRGYKANVDLLVDSKYGKGFSNRISIDDRSDLIGINNYSAVLQTKRAFTCIDPVISNKHRDDLLSIDGYTAVLQTRRAFAVSDDLVASADRENIISFSDYTAVLQTSTGVT